MNIQLIVRITIILNFGLILINHLKFKKIMLEQNFIMEHTLFITKSVNEHNQELIEKNKKLNEEIKELKKKIDIENSEKEHKN